MGVTEVESYQCFREKAGEHDNAVPGFVSMMDSDPEFRRLAEAWLELGPTTRLEILALVEE